MSEWCVQSVRVVHAFVPPITILCIFFLATLSELCMPMIVFMFPESLKPIRKCRYAFLAHCVDRPVPVSCLLVAGSNDTTAVTFFLLGCSNLLLLIPKFRPRQLETAPFWSCYLQYSCFIIDNLVERKVGKTLSPPDRALAERERELQCRRLCWRWLARLTRKWSGSNGL